MCLKKSVFILIQTTGVKIGTFFLFLFFLLHLISQAGGETNTESSAPTGELREEKQSKIN